MHSVVKAYFSKAKDWHSSELARPRAVMRYDAAAANDDGGGRGLRGGDNDRATRGRQTHVTGVM